MRRSPTSRRLRLLGGPIAVLLAAVGTSCSCPDADPGPPQLTLFFNADTLGNRSPGFRRAEVRSAYLVRYRNADFTGLLDTLRQPPRTPAPTSYFNVFYGSTGPAVAPVPEYVAPNVFAKSFRLEVPAAGRSYAIRSLAVEYGQSGGRCSVSRVERFDATVNGRQEDVRYGYALSK